MKNNFDVVVHADGFAIFPNFRNHSDKRNSKPTKTEELRPGFLRFKKPELVKFIRKKIGLDMLRMTTKNRIHFTYRFLRMAETN